MYRAVLLSLIIGTAEETHIVTVPVIHHVSKNCANLFLSALCQISTNFDNFLQKDDKEAKIMRDALVFHLT